MRREKIAVYGVVQGVGFRPFVVRLARRLHLAGFVKNVPGGVEIEAEGSQNRLNDFVRRLTEEAPPLARIAHIKRTPLKPCNQKGFAVKPSTRRGRKCVLLPPDVATCDACLQEVFDPKNRRYLYPFTNCTNCGPRYTIVLDLPYDRDRTTMREFAMCEECRREYDDITDRRYHAQPNACHICGPHVWLCDSRGRRISAEDPIRRAVKMLKDGKILAIKGMGGFHIACDPQNDKVLRRLRERKKRPAKPFALMVANAETARRFVHLSPAAEELFNSWRAPIVLAPKNKDAPVSQLVAPNLSDLGVMLPYTPLHHILLHTNFEALVMTSGNRAEEPTIHENGVALDDLSDFVDAFLLHNRPISVQNDDSVVRDMFEDCVMVRRARGWVPEPVELPLAPPSLVALGAEEKNTICLTRLKEAFISQHLGDMHNLRTYQAFEATLEHIKRLFQIKPTLVVHDMHPDYFTTKHAVRMGLRRLAVQHHHAHILSCLAEHGLKEPVIGVAYDGVGYGADGTVWGAEILFVDGARYKRIGTWRQIALAGGEAAIRKTWKVAVAVLYDIFGGRMHDVDIPLFSVVKAEDVEAVLSMLKAQVAVVGATSMGRWFDAAAAICGICFTNTYEGQAPAELEAALWKLIKRDIPKNPYRYPYSVRREGERFVADPSDAVVALVGDVASGRDCGEIALGWHEMVASATVDLVRAASQRFPTKTVVLSGGSFQNRFLHLRIRQLLQQNGFRVLTHTNVPPNDGGVSLGQALFAAFASRR